MDGTPPVLLNVIKIIFFREAFFKRFLPIDWSSTVGFELKTCDRNFRSNFA